MWFGHFLTETNEADGKTHCRSIVDMSNFVKKRKGQKEFSFRVNQGVRLWDPRIQRCAVSCHVSTHIVGLIDKPDRLNIRSKPLVISEARILTSLQHCISVDEMPTVLFSRK